MKNLSAIAELPRHMMSDDYNSALMKVKEVAERRGLNFHIHSYSTGYDCGTWIIPEKWTLNRAVLRSTAGEALLDSYTEPLACLSYSLPFEGRVSREELLQHLYTSPHCPQAVPFVFKTYARDWGLCGTRSFVDGLTDEEYDVSIDTEFTHGELLVGEIVAPGEFDESFILVSHLCHPCQVNDGPIGVFPGIEILSRLKDGGQLHYTLRQLVVPENIGSAAWLSDHSELIPKIKGGLFVEMIGTDLPIRLNRSFKGDTLVDDFFAECLIEISPNAIVDGYVYANDERQFNGPGVRVPMLGLNRSMMSPGNHSMAAFPYYHTDADTMANVNEANLVEAIEVLDGLIRGFDRYLVQPVPHFIGEPFLHRYGLHTDVFDSYGLESGSSDRGDKIDHSNLVMDVLFNTGEGRTVYQIARSLQIHPEAVRSILDRFVDSGLISYQALR